MRFFCLSETAPPGVRTERNTLRPVTWVSMMRQNQSPVCFSFSHICMDSQKHVLQFLLTHFHHVTNCTTLNPNHISVSVEKWHVDGVTLNVGGAGRDTDVTCSLESLLQYQWLWYNRFSCDFSWFHYSCLNTVCVEPSSDDDLSKSGFLQLKLPWRQEISDLSEGTLTFCFGSELNCTSVRIRTRIHLLSRSETRLKSGANSSRSQPNPENLWKPQLWLCTKKLVILYDLNANCH